MMEIGSNQSPNKLGLPQKRESNSGWVRIIIGERKKKVYSCQKDSFDINIEFGGVGIKLGGAWRNFFLVSRHTAYGVAQSNKEIGLVRIEFQPGKY